MMISIMEIFCFVLFGKDVVSEEGHLSVYAGFAFCRRPVCFTTTKTYFSRFGAYDV